MLVEVVTKTTAVTINQSDGGCGVSRCGHKRGLAADVLTTSVKIAVVPVP